MITREADGYAKDLPVDLTPVARVGDQDHQPVVIHCVHDPVVLGDPDSPHATHAGQHPCSCGPRIIPQCLRGCSDALDDLAVKLAQ